jgi:hypothetical protein
VLKSGQKPAAKVAELAGKFHGSGGPVNHNAQTLVVQSLIGNDIPITGQIPAQGGREVSNAHTLRDLPPMLPATQWPPLQSGARDSPSLNGGSVIFSEGAVADGGWSFRPAAVAETA